MTLDQRKSYLFKVVIEEDGFEDGRQAYHAFCPALDGCHSWGYTKETALSNVQEVAQMIVNEMKEDSLSIPQTINDVKPLSGVYVTVNTFNE
jgi:Uncharacterized conserved protein